MYFRIYVLIYQLLNFPVIFYSMKQIPICKSESRLAGSEIYAIFEIHHGVYMNSSQHLF